MSKAFQKRMYGTKGTPNPRHDHDRARNARQVRRSTVGTETMINIYEINSAVDMTASIILVLCFVTDTILILSIKYNKLSPDNSYYNLNMKYGFVISSLIKLILIFVIIHEIYAPSLKIGALLMIITAYCFYVINMFIDFHRLRRKKREG